MANGVVNKVAGTGDKQPLLQSYAKVRALKERLGDLVILASHDGTAAEKLATEKTAVLS